MTHYKEPGLFDIRNYQLTFGHRDLVRTGLAVTLSSAAAFATKPSLGDVGGALFLVLGITIAGALSGLAAALLAALAAFLLYNFYFAEPVLTLRIATGSDIAPLIVFNLCAAVSGLLAGRLKDRAQAASHSNHQLAGLLEVSEALQSALRIQDIAAVLAAPALDAAGMQVRLFRICGNELMALGAMEPEPDWSAAAQLGLEAEAPVIERGDLNAYRLVGSDGAATGIMVVRHRAGAPLKSEFMTGLGHLVALTLERATLSEMIAETRATARTEELKTALLSSVSHDFRTPLTAISASASSLIDYRDQLDTRTSLRLLHGIVDECARLNRYTANLLEMSRLEAGEGPRRLQTLGVSEMLSAVVHRVRQRAGRRSIRRMPMPGGADLLVNADAALFELALVNVLDNAIRYSEDGSRISIECGAEANFCWIAIADEGQGMPEGELERVFQRFYRIPRSEPSPHGSGLGLAIARGFVEALGGTIEARTPGIDGMGTRIVIQLPLAEEKNPA